MIVKYRSSFHVKLWIRCYIFSIVLSSIMACQGDSQNSEHISIEFLPLRAEDHVYSSDDMTVDMSGMDISDFSSTVGDPQLGFNALVNEGYVSCGIPEAMSNFIPLGDESDRIAGRNELNQDMPYFLTKYQADSGVNLMVANCLTCHASRFNGNLVIGLGDVFQNYAQDLSGAAQLALNVADQILQTQEEIDEFTKFTSRSLTLAPYARTLTAGTNPAINITAGIMSHLDPMTLRWSDTEILEVSERYKTQVVPANPPPWWWYKKKTSMFYSGSGGGNHIAWSMLASSMCLDNVEQARKIASYFPHILAYIKSIEPPEYPWDINDSLAQEGQEIFTQNCSRCHGTYGMEDTYPEVLIPLDDIGVDEYMAIRMYNSEEFHQWIADSFFGQASVATPKLGYVAPPLDGVWATAPYLHNGSVPSIALVLESTKRPQCWTWSYDSTDYNQSTLGWNYNESPCHSEMSDDREKAFVYDTQHEGYGKEGHTYGDALSATERTALVEYLKTL